MSIKIDIPACKRKAAEAVSAPGGGKSINRLQMALWLARIAGNFKPAAVSPNENDNDENGTMTTLPFTRARPDAAIEALKRLAVAKSIELPRPLISALFEIGMKGEADASSAEWALIDLVDLMFGLMMIGRPPQTEGH